MAQGERGAGLPLRQGGRQATDRHPGAGPGVAGHAQVGPGQAGPVAGVGTSPCRRRTGGRLFRRLRPVRQARQAQLLSAGGQDGRRRDPGGGRRPAGGQG